MDNKDGDNLAPSPYNYDKGRTKTRTTGMHPSKSHNHTPAPDDTNEHGAPSEVTEQLEAIKAAIAEAEDICAEFAIEMYREAQQTAREAERLSKEIGE